MRGDLRLLSLTRSLLFVGSVALLGGCAHKQPMAAAPPEPSDDVHVSLCGTQSGQSLEGEEESEGKARPWGVTEVDGRIQVCLVLNNPSQGPLTVLKSRILLVGGGEKRGPMGDQEGDTWETGPGTKGSFNLTFDARNLTKGDEIKLLFKQAVLQSGNSISIRPMKLELR